MQIQSGHRALPLFFVIGRERSGTTLLKSCLDAHPHLCIPVEALITVNLFSKYYLNNKRFTKAQLESFIGDLFSLKQTRKLGIEENEIREWLYRFELPTFGEAIKSVYYLYNIKNGSKQLIMIGDKNPSHILHINLLRKIFPEAKFIALVRDYHTQIKSIRGVSLETKNIASLACRWKFANSRILALKRKNPELVHIIRFEELICQKREELYQICNFLGIEFSEEMISGRLNRLGLFNNYTQKIHQSTLGKIDPDKTKIYPIDFSLNELKTMEAIAGDVGIRFGYVKQIEISNIEKTIVKIRTLLSQIYGISYLLSAQIIVYYPFKIRLILQRMVEYLFKNRHTKSEQKS